MRYKRCRDFFFLVSWDLGSRQSKMAVGISHFFIVRENCERIDENRLFVTHWPITALDFGEGVKGGGSCESPNHTQSDQ